MMYHLYSSLLFLMFSLALCLYFKHGSINKATKKKRIITTMLRWCCCFANTKSTPSCLRRKKKQK